MPFLLVGSSNDIESGDLKIKPGTSNVFDPINPCFLIDELLPGEISKPSGILECKISKDQAQKLKYYIENGYRPVIQSKIYLNDDKTEWASFFYRLQAITNIGDIYNIPTDNFSNGNNLAYFGDNMFDILNYDNPRYSEYYVFDMDNMRLFVRTTSGIVPDGETNANKLMMNRSLQKSTLKE